MTPFFSRSVLKWFLQLDSSGKVSLNFKIFIFVFSLITALSCTVIALRYNYGDSDYKKDEWTKEETEIVQNYAEELFRYYLSIYPLPELEKIDSIIIMFYKAKVDIKEMLLDWKKVISVSSILHLSDLICGGFKGAKSELLSSPFADEQISKIVFNWLNTDYELAQLKPKIEEIIMNPKELDEWKLNEINWTYEKLNELDFKRVKK